MQPMLAYFAAEKQGAMLLLVVGAISVCAATSLFFSRGPYMGAAVPFVALGLLAVGIGAAVWARTDHQVAWLTDKVKESPAAAAHLEVPRMQRVRRSFLTAQMFELVLIAAGTLMTLRYASGTFRFAFGAGLVAQGAFLLVFDLIAAARANRYLAFLIAAG